MVKFYFFSFIFILFFGTANAQVPTMNPIAGPSALCGSPSALGSFTASASNSPSSFSWTVTPAASIGTVGNGSVCNVSFPPGNGTYTLICAATNSTGTSAPVSYVVSVFETPNVTFSGATSFCQGSSTNIQASSTMYSASPTVSYSWSPPGGLNTTSGPNVIAFPASSTIYTCTAVNGPCSNSGTINITVLPVPSLTVSVSNPTVCYGDFTTFTASGANFYSWGGGITNGVPFAAYFSAWYQVTGYNTFGCSSTAWANITVNPAPFISVASNPTMACIGQSVAITMSGTSASYTFNGIPISGNTVAVTPTVTTTYTISGTTSQGCKGTTVYTQSVGCAGIMDPKSADYKGLRAYPNPSSGEFSLSSDYDEVVFIYNELGQLTRSISLKAEEKISINDLSPGIYFVSSERIRIKVIVTE